MLYYPKSHGHKESASYDPFASHSAPAQEKVTNFEKNFFHIYNVIWIRRNFLKLIFQYSTETFSKSWSPKDRYKATCSPLA